MNIAEIAPICLKHNDLHESSLSLAELVHVLT